VTHDTITISPGSRFRAALVLAIIADALQIVIFPLFIGGAASPLMTYSISVLEPCWFTFLAGTGNFCHRFLPSSCPESI